MNYLSKKIRSPIKTHGGKSYMARRIISWMPEHSTYCEPFAGGLSVLLNKPPSMNEVAGDLNYGIINLWVHLRDHIDGLMPWLRDATYSRETWDRYTRLDDPKNPWTTLGRALAFLIRNRFSRGGLGKDFAWSDRLRGKRREGGPVPGELNSWDTIRAELPLISRRIRDVEFRNCSAMSLIGSHDDRDTLFYCDPPYVHSTRTHKKAYAFEMDEEAHGELLDTLLSCRGMVMISGYRNPLYEAAFKHWTCMTWEMPNHSGQGKTKQRRIECLWINPAAIGRLTSRVSA